MNEFLPGMIFFCWLIGFWFLWKIPLIRNSGVLKPFCRSVSIIIPARNEEKNLGRLLTSLEDQACPPMEIIVVDDQSEDRTFEIAEERGCRSIRSLDLPPGWAGKPWACIQGARQAQEDLLLFLDADTVVPQDGLENLLMSFSGEHEVVTVQPYHCMKRAYERLSAVFNIIVLGGSNAFTPLGTRLKPMGAFGPCLLSHKHAYWSVGGHESVQGAILENVALGKIFLDAGYRVTCYGGKGVLSFRMYSEGFHSMVAGFTKSFGVGANTISWINFLMITCWVFGSVSTTRHSIQSVLLGDGFSCAMWTGLYIFYGIQIYWMLFRIGNFGIWPALLYPIPVLFFIFVFVISLFKTIFIRKVPWKGRSVRTRGGET